MVSDEMNVGHMPVIESITEAREVNTILVGQAWLQAPILFEPHGLREMGDMASPKKMRALLPSFERGQLGLPKQGAPSGSCPSLQVQGQLP